MNNEGIKPWSIVVIYLAYMTGSVIINIQDYLFDVAKFDAWLSLLVANIVGLLLLYCVMYMNKMYPGQIFIDYIKNVIGQMAAFIVGIPFILFLLLIISSMMYRTGLFFTSEMMRNTPLYIIISVIFLVSIITVAAGLRVITQMFIPLIYFIISSVAAILIFCFPCYEPSSLLPLFADGLMPFWNGVYLSLGYPNGDILYFSSILAFIVHDKDEGRFIKWMYGAHFVNTVILALSIMCSIMALGPLTGVRKFPLYQIAQFINIGNHIERLESIFGIILILGTYMKLTFLIFIVQITMVRLFRLKDEKSLLFHLGIVSLLLSLTMFQNELALSKIPTAQPIISFTIVGIPLFVAVLLTKLRKVRVK